MTNNYLPFLCLLFLCVISVSGHGNMVWPPVWQDAGGKWGLTPMGQFVIGGDIFFEYEGQPDFEKSGVVTLWYTNYTHITIEPTIEDHMRTFPNIEPGTEKFIAHNPWMAPGSAPVYSGCGIAGGNPDGCGKPMGPGQDCGDYKGGFSFGPRAEDYDFTDIFTTEWIRYTQIYIHGKIGERIFIKTKMFMNA